MPTKPKAELIDARLSVREMRQAIKIIERRVTELNAVNVDEITERDDPNLRALQFSIRGTLSDIFGSNSTQYQSYVAIGHLDKAPHNYLPEFAPKISEIRDGYRRGIAEALAVFRSIKEDFESKIDDEAAEKENITNAYASLDLHLEIKRVVGTLYANGHYSEAVEKSIKVLNSMVRMRSDVEIDGVPLMQKVFSANNPILAFNNLSDQSDRDEQKGFMDLYAGAVMGLRNPRAHKIIEDDPKTAIAFIGFISLLVMLLDKTKIMQPK